MSITTQTESSLPPALEGNRGLTYRQMQMLAMVAQGMTTPEIAIACHVAFDTANRTIFQMRRRLGAKNIAHAVTLGIAYEFISLGPDGEVAVPDKFNYLVAA